VSIKNAVLVIGRIFQKVLLSILMVAFLVGCSGGNNNNVASNKEGENFSTPKQDRDDYIKETKNLELPPGINWPDAEKLIVEKAPDGNGIVYGVGHGVGMADGFYFCSWKKTYLKTSDDALKQKAIASFDIYKTTDEYTKYADAGTKAMYDKEITEAKLGDLTAMQRDVDLNCG
jgi:hypothetical protein